MRIIRDLKLTPVWVSPDHLVSSATHLLKGHKVPALPVMEDGQIVGIVTFEQMIGIAITSRIRDVMVPCPVEISAQTPIRKVAEVFSQKNLEWAPVLDGHQLLGIVTSTMLLRELARSWDPLTNLSWSDALREWGIEQLTEGNEISIVFIDLDDFGAYNKKYGHIVGDRILRYFADFLKQTIEPEYDVLVRYGGDEFAIGSTRSRVQVDSMVASLKERAVKMQFEDLPEPATFSVGVFGGRRGKERENVHVGATLDALINLASRDCLANKKRLVALQEATPLPDPKPEAREAEEPDDLVERPTILMVSASELGASAPTTVGIRWKGAIFTGVDIPGQRPVVESVARATARAMERAFPGTAVIIQEITLGELADGERLISVSGKVSENGQDRAIAAMGPVGPDLFKSVAESTLEAILPPQAVKSSAS